MAGWATFRPRFWAPPQDQTRSLATLSGQTTVMGAGVGVFSETSPPALFRLSMPETVAAYALTGNAAILKPGIVVGAGAFTLTGVVVAFQFRVSMAEAVGVYVLTGNAASLTQVQLMGAGVGAFSLSGKDVVFSLIETAIEFPVDTGPFLVAAPEVTFCTTQDAWAGAARDIEVWSSASKDVEVWTTSGKEAETWDKSRPC